MHAVARSTRSRRGCRPPLLVILGLLAGCGTDEVLFPDGAAVDSGPEGQSAATEGEAGPLDPATAPPDASSGPSEPVDEDSAPAPLLDGATSEPPDAAGPVVPGCSEQSNPPYAGRCTSLAFAAVRFNASASLAGHAPQTAFDGDTCTAWHAGAAPPQWVETELCTGTRCPAMPRIAKLALYVDRDLGAPVTVELQGATVAGRLTSAYHTMASASFTAVDGYAEIAVGVDALPAMRVLVNSGPARPVVIREVAFLACP